MSIDILSSTLTLLIRAQELLKIEECEVLHTALDTLLEKIDPVRRADRAVQKRAKNSAIAERPDESAEDPSKAERGGEIEQPFC